MTSPSASGRHHQRQVARWVRRVPGLQSAVGEVVRRVRRNAVVTDLVWRIFMPDSTLGVRPVALHPGRYLQGHDAVFLPVIGVLGVDLTGAQAEALMDRVSVLQREELSFRPLLILDRPVLAAARRHGYVVELLTPRDHWGSMPGGSADPDHWVDHAGRRLAGIVEHYQIFHLARSAGDRIDPLDEALIRNLGRRLPQGLDVRVTAL